MNWNHFSFSHGARYQTTNNRARHLHRAAVYCAMNRTLFFLLSLQNMIIFFNFFLLLSSLLLLLCLLFAFWNGCRCRMQRMWWQLNKCGGKAIEYIRYKREHIIHIRIKHEYFLCVCFFHLFFHVDRVYHLFLSLFEIPSEYLYGMDDACIQTNMYNSV